MKHIPDGLGVNIHFTDARPGELQMLAGAGVRWVRMDLIWRTTETEKGQYDFTAYDRLLDSLDAHGLKALLILNDTNPLYNGDEFPCSEGILACARWAAAAAARFRGRGVLWEMWNEPNLTTERGKAPDAAAYAKLALAVGEAMRRAAPDERFIGPATSLIDLPFLEKCFQAGLLDYWSAVTVHPYRFKDPETVIPEYEALRALIARYAPPERTVPVYQGEWGWASSGYDQNILWFRNEMDDEIQGRLLARQWLTNLMCGIPFSIWYDWHDDGPDPQNPEHNCGMVRHPYREGCNPVYEPKPAYWAAHALIESLRGFRFSEALPTSRPEDFILVFRREREVRFAAWTTDSEPHIAAIPVTEGVWSIVSHLGESLGVLASEMGQISLALTNDPQYVIAGDKPQQD